MRISGMAPSSQTAALASAAVCKPGGMSPVPDRVAARISARIAAIGESPTLAVDAKAKALQAAGEKVVNFGAGEPDFPTPAHIVEAAIAACRDPRNHRYTPAAGLPELREAVAEKTARDSGYAVAPSQVVITNGGKQAVYETFACLLDPGDEVIVPAPYWVTYPEAIALAGGVPVAVDTTVANGFRVSVEQLDAAWTERTKALLFVSPSNPTGAVYHRDEIEAIGRWAEERGVWVVTDEIYEHLVYGDARFHSLPVVVPGMAERCVVIHGVAKTYAMTGWRVGWMVAPADVAKAAANLQSHLSSNVANVSQRAALAALTGDQSSVATMREAFDRRRRRIVDLLRGVPGVVTAEPEGAFYAFPSFENVLGRPIRHQTPGTTVELAELILDEAKVAIVPGEAFGAPGYARMAYALGDDDLTEGVTRIAKLLAE
jgi:aspartate/methionine/tyrosine aminotransferase